MCVYEREREKTTGWRRPPPTVARGREKHSLSLFGLLARSHPPLLSLSLSLSRGSSSEAMHNDCIAMRLVSTLN